MIQDHDGTDIIGANGEKIGTVERTYDDAEGRPNLVEVKIGAIVHKHRLLPLANATPVDAGLRVPYTKSMVENSPDASDADGTLSGDLLQQVRSYYAESAKSSIPVTGESS
ncbi:MAG: PRC-barrel domain-containing protein [Chloroflexota bacterium]|nr:PRC-barrel domain-containing protein [Chloroflexota bacterium]